MSEASRPSPTIPKPFIQSQPTPVWPSIQRDIVSPVEPAKMRRMNLNESPFAPSPKAIEAMQAVVGRVNIYPDPKWRDLAAVVSARTGHPANRIVFGNGSDELIVQAGRLALFPGDEVLTAVPSFPSYGKCAVANGAKLVTVPVRQDGAPDVDGMLEAVTDKTRIVFLCTPNNPTGGLLTTEEVMKLARGVPDTALLVVDEAYYEYGVHAGGETHLQALAERKGPWACFRSFSKAYCLAGIRVGYALCGSDDLADAFQKMRSVFNVNAVAQAAALAAYQDLDHVHSVLERTRIERERIHAGLVRMGFEPFPSVGNFLAAKSPVPAAGLVKALEQKGILIGRLIAPGYEDWIRVTTATAEDTDALLAAIAEVLAGK